MNAKRTTRRSTRTNQTTVKTQWGRLTRISDAGIQRAVRADPDAAPIADADWFRKAKIVLPKPKQAVSIRLDQDVTAWFKRQGSGYQTRINAVLRAYVEAQR
jgi:uncharacterized protein (DUF4415 family)